jgi:hypothetical protein
MRGGRRWAVRRPRHAQLIGEVWPLEAKQKDGGGEERGWRQPRRDTEWGDRWSRGLGFFYGSFCGEWWAAGVGRLKALFFYRLGFRRWERDGKRMGCIIADDVASYGADFGILE